MRVSQHISFSRIILFLGFYLIIGYLCINFMSLSNTTVSNVTNKSNVLNCNYSPIGAQISTVIIIDNNWTESKDAGICVGNGTKSYPYCIQNKMIDAHGLDSCIIIRNSETPFIIQNCTLYNPGNEYSDSGIKCINVSYGQILNNSVSESQYGLYFIESHNHLIFGNDFICEFGVNFENSTNITVYYNNLIYEFIDRTSEIKWDSPKRMQYIYKNQNYTSYISNFHQEYNGYDSNNNGIGEIQVIIKDSVDYIASRYPLMEPIQNFLLIGTVEEETPTTTFTISGYFFLPFFVSIGVIWCIGKKLLTQNKESI